MRTIKNKYFTFNKPLIGFITIFLLIISVLFSIDKGPIWSFYNIYELFNSDALFFSNLYNDLFVDNSNMIGANITTTPNVFPCMIFFFILRFLIGNFIFAQLANGILQFLLLFFFIYKLFKHFSIEKYFNVSCALFSLFIWYTVFNKDLTFFFLWSFLPYHIGAFIFSLVSLLFVLKYMENRKNIFLLLIFIINFLTIFSNKIYIVYFIAPVSFVLLFFLLQNDRKKILYLLIVNVSSTILALFLFELFIKLNFFTVSTYLAPFIDVKTSMSIMLNHYYSFFYDGWIRIIIMIICVLSLIFSAIYLVKNRYLILKNNENSKEKSFYLYIAFILCFSVVAFFAPALKGFYESVYNIRYNIFVLFFLVLNFPFIIYLFTRNAKLTYFKYLNVLIIIIPLILLSLIFAKTNFSKELNEIKNYKNEVAKKLNKVYLENPDLKSGVSSFWDSRNTTMFNDFNIRVVGVDDSFKPFSNSTNINWYYKKDNTPVFNFVILHVMANDEFLKQKFGNRLEKLIEEDGIRIYKTPNFIYDESLNPVFLPLLFKGDSVFFSFDNINYEKQKIYSNNKDFFVNIKYSDSLSKNKVFNSDNEEYLLTFDLINVKAGDTYEISYKKFPANENDLFLNVCINSPSDFLVNTNEYSYLKDNWAELKFKFVVPQNLNEKLMTVFIKNTSKKKYYIDDFKIKLI